MKSSYIGMSILFCVGVMLTLTTNCDNVRLSLKQPETFSSKIEGEICTLPPAAVNSATKIVFLIDQSGSNNQTDPGKKYRYGVIKEFVDSHASDPNLYWSVIVFGSPGGGAEKATALINNGDDQVATFTPAVANMYAALNTFNASKDEGRTPYHKAIDMAINAIKTDKAAATNTGHVTYLAVLMSDGVPTDTEYGNPLNQTTIDTDAKRFPAEGTRLSTIYYGPDEVDPPTRLESMATNGNGKFSNVNKAGRVPIDKLVVLPYAEPWVMKRFVVANLNAAPCDDGTMDADSDSDGICDKDEIAYNKLWQNDPTYSQFKTRMGGKTFDPTNRNSFGSVYNDLIYFKNITGGDLLDTACTDVSDEDHDLLNACEEAFLHSSSNSGPNADWTAKMGTDSDPRNFDSDGDGFIDWLELVFEKTSFAGLNYNSTTRLIDGYRMDEIISQYRNPRKPGAGQAYDGSFRFSRINGQGQSCYTYSQTVLPLYHTLKVTTSQVSNYVDLAHDAEESVIMVYFIQTPQSDPNGPGEMRYSFQHLKVGQSALDLNLHVEDYKSVAPGTNGVGPARVGTK